MSSFIYTPFYHTGTNILSFEIDPPPQKDLHGCHFVYLTFSNLTNLFVLSFLTLIHMYTKFQVPAISRSAQNKNYIFFSSVVP